MFPAILEREFITLLERGKSSTIPNWHELFRTGLAKISLANQLATRVQIKRRQRIRVEMKLITIHNTIRRSLNCETCHNCYVFDKGIIYDVDSVRINRAIG